MISDALTYRYLSVLVVIVVSTMIGLFMLFISKLVRPQRAYTLKLTPYECGIPSTEDTWERFDVKFYIVALVFVIFEIEAIFIYSWAVVYRKIGLYALIEMYLFIFILLIAYFYALGKNVFDWKQE